MGMGAVPHFQCSRCSEGTPQRPQGDPRGHSGCRGCCCSAQIPDTLSQPRDTCRQEKSGVSGYQAAFGSLPGSTFGDKDGEVVASTDDDYSYLPEVFKNAHQHSRARSPVNTTLLSPSTEECTPTNTHKFRAGRNKAHTSTHNH